MQPGHDDHRGHCGDPYYPGPALPAVDTNATGFLVTHGMLAWGATLEPAPDLLASIRLVAAPFLNGNLSASELSALTSTCNFIQGDGTGFGICKSCRTGALAGTKK